MIFLRTKLSTRLGLARAKIPLVPNRPVNVGQWKVPGCSAALVVNEHTGDLGSTVGEEGEEAAIDPWLGEEFVDHRRTEFAECRADALDDLGGVVVLVTFAPHKSGSVGRCPLVLHRDLSSESQGA